MLKNTLIGLDKKKLKQWLLLFFFALAIPTVLLIQQSYSRLKWETFHQHQLMAGELATRIDNQFIRLINKEEERSFTDYSFLNIVGDPKANLLQRSPLSKFPIESEIDGIIGFFQVNNQGELMTPLVPEAIKLGKSANTFGITNDELRSRLALQDRIQHILSKNKLVRKVESSNQPVLAQIDADNNVDNNVTEGDQGDMTRSVFSSVGRSNKHDESQVAFDRLKKMPSNKVAQANLGRAEDLKSSKSHEKKVSQHAAQVAKSKASNEFSKAASERTSKQVRKEQNVLPESELADIIYPVEESTQSQSQSQSLDYVDSYGSRMRESISSDSISSDSAVTALKKDEAVGAQPPVNSKRSLKILTFESTIDPFEFSQLDSGHFVLYRNVWLNDQRYIQGLLIEQHPFFDSIINTAFRNASLAQMSDLQVIHQETVLTTFSGQNTTYLNSSLRSKDELSGEFSGALLYQTRLSAPLSDVQLLFNITQLPIGAGGKVILWLSVILASILCAGFYLMYRLGLGQINLARQQQDFVSAVSHELKTPLTSIRMYGEILREGWADEAKKKSYYNFIYHESERLSRLINNVLHLARMTRNEQPAVIKSINVEELIDEVNSKVSTQIRQAGYKLVIHGDNLVSSENEVASSVEVDEDWFIQIMINLVDNAIKFSSNSEVKQIDLSYKRSNNKRANKDTIDFLVRDYGSGIDKKQMKKIFKLFYRSESELTRETAGTGIGLALVHQMVATMGGEVDVVNRSPGAEFRVSFPAG